jgi:hypothetical protein
MRIDIEGTTFCVSGNFQNFQNTRTVEAKLKAQGGKTSKSMGVKTQVLIAGSGWVPKRDDATDRGLPVLDEKELTKLLEDGSIEIDFSPPGAEVGDANLDELLGEVRGLLAQPPSSKLWNALVEVLDQCQRDQTDALITYVQDHISRWSTREKLLCVSPHHWQVNMANGIESPLYTLVHRLDLNKANLKSNDVKRMLALEHLGNVRYLDLAVDKKLTKTVFRQLAKDRKFADVEHLNLGFFDVESVKELATDCEMKNIKRLGLYPSDYWRVEGTDYKALFAIEALQNVERLVLYSRHSWGTDTARPLGMLQDTSLLPSFSHLEINFANFGNCTNNPVSPKMASWTYNPNQSSDLDPAAVERIKTLTITTTIGGYINEDTPYNFRMLPNLETLRFYAHPRMQEIDEEKLMKDLSSVFIVGKMKVPGSLKRVVTNAPIDRGPFAEFAKNNPDIELVHDPLPEPLAPEAK